MNGTSALERVAIVATLFAFWLLLSGNFTAFLIAAGACCAAAVAWLTWRMEVADREGHPLHLSLVPVVYWPWLAKEIVKSGWQVTRIILDPKLPVSPTLARFKPSQKTVVGLVTHANSITLTPGTLTVEAGHDEFLVHALTREGARSVLDSEMDRRISRVEGSG